MAFSGSFSNITDTTAIFTASFTGGDANYDKWRMVKLIVSDPNAASYNNETVIISAEKGGGSSSFTSLIQNLSPETEYSWKAEVGYGPSPTDSSKIVWLGELDEAGSTIKYSASGSFETEADGTTSYFTASEMEVEKYTITFYASFTYDANISPYVTEMNKLTIIYGTDPTLTTGTTTIRFDSSEHTATSDTDGIYTWDGEDISIGGLKAGKTYYWKAFCGPVADAGSVSGYIISNTTTLPPEPNALSLKILPISTTKAILTATYYDAETTSLSDFNTLHYKFSTNGGTTWGSYSTCSGTVDTDNHFIVFETVVRNLSSDTNYIYRAYVGSTDPWEE